MKIEIKRSEINNYKKRPVGIIRYNNETLSETTMREFNETIDEAIIRQRSDNYICQEICKEGINNFNFEIIEDEKIDEELNFFEPRIYTRCPACKMSTLVVNNGKLLCTWHKCPDPTLIDRIWEGTIKIIWK